MSKIFLLALNQGEEILMDMTKTRGPLLGGLIRQRRKKLSMTMQELADTAGVSVGYVSQIERDMAVPTLGTLAQIADALGVEIEYFVKSQKPTDAISWADGRQKFFMGGSSVRYEAVTNQYPGSEISSFILNVPAKYESETVSHEGEEIIFVLEGMIHQVLDGQIFEMRSGDCLHFDGAAPHSWSNPTDQEARVLWTGKLKVLNKENRHHLSHLTTTG
jgi:transcriptional regulator with XRE-family HTH domain